MCRPCPGRDIARGPEDIQRFYIIMMPTSRKAPVRLLTMGTTKRMPDQGERFWGAVLDTKSSVCDFNATHICIRPSAPGQGSLSLLRCDRKATGTTKFMPNQGSPAGVLARTPNSQCALLLSFLSCLIKGGDTRLGLLRGVVRDAKIYCITANAYEPRHT